MSNASSEAATWTSATAVIPQVDETQAPADSGRYYRPELDWLRFFAFSLVFWRHVWQVSDVSSADIGVPAILVAVFQPILAAGLYGVDLFFALSAFLITKLLLLERDRTGAIHVQSFYIRRVLRIWPLYFAFVLLLLPFEVLNRNVPITYYGSLLTFTANWFATWNQPNFSSFCSPLWSLCVEEQFYLLWPLLIGRKKLYQVAAIMMGLLAFTCIYRYFYIYNFAIHIGSQWTNTLTRLDCFAMGGLLAIALHTRELTLSRLLRFTLFAAGLGLFWYIGTMPEAGQFYDYGNVTYPLAAVASGLFIIAFVTTPPRNHCSRPLRMLAYLGKISYGLYIFHWGAILFWQELLPVFGTSPPWLYSARTLLVVLATLIPSILSYKYFERPFLSLKQRFTYVPSRVD